MKLVAALCRFDGRISRATYWLGLAAIIVVFGFGRYLLKAGLGVESLSPDPFPVAAFTALSVVPLTALTVQRLADRDRPSWLGYAYGATVALFAVAPQFGALDSIDGYSTAEHLAFWPLLALTLFVLVEAGFLPSRSRDDGFRWIAAHSSLRSSLLAFAHGKSDSI